MEKAILIPVEAYECSVCGEMIDSCDECYINVDNEFYCDDGSHYCLECGKQIKADRAIKIIERG